MRTTGIALAVFLLAGLMLLVVTGEVQAGGFYVPLKGAGGIGVINAGSAARANDGSTIYFNPAGMTQLEGTLLQGGIDFSRPSVEIKNTGSTTTTPGTLGAALASPGRHGDAGELTPAPTLYVAFPMPHKVLWFGLAITSPFGLNLEYDKGWFGRYDSIHTKLVTIDIAPSFAYKINESWSIGGGIDMQYADAKLTNALPNTLIPGGPTLATDGFATLTGNDWSLGFNIGVLFGTKLGTRIGLHYRSGMSHTLKGDTTIEGLQGPLMAANGKFGTSANLDLPPIVSFGIAHNLAPTLTLLGEVQWFGWHTFDEIRIKFDNGSPTAPTRSAQPSLRLARSWGRSTTVATTVVAT